MLSPSDTTLGVRSTRNMKSTPNLTVLLTTDLVKGLIGKEPSLEVSLKSRFVTLTLKPCFGGLCRNREQRLLPPPVNILHMSLVPMCKREAY